MNKKPRRNRPCARARYVLHKLGAQFFLADNDLPVSLRLLLILIFALGFALVGDLINVGSCLVSFFAAPG